MNVTNPDLVIVRGINETWLKENFSQMWIGFGGPTVAPPAQDAYFVGLYINKPVSAIKYIGIVSSIDRYANNVADFNLKGLIELPHPVFPGHAIRKHENWDINSLGLNPGQIALLRQMVTF